MAQSVTRALQAIKRYDAPPENIDFVILSAINVSLCLASHGDRLVSEGFNVDVAANGRDYRHPAASWIGLPV
jgi:cell division protein ZapA (FtsZ GTPase activity inhibitor)